MEIAKPEQYNFSFNSAELNEFRTCIAMLNNVIGEIKKLDCDTLSDSDCCFEVSLETLEIAREGLVNLINCNMMY